MLKVNAARSARERVTLLRGFEDLRGLGYEGGYGVVRRYAAAWKRRQGTGTAAAFVPLSFAPGEAYQFDWSHEVVPIAGATVTVKVAHLRLCHSRMPFIRAYPRKTQGRRIRRRYSTPMTGRSFSGGGHARAGFTTT